MTYEVATLEEYGFNEHKVLKIVWHVLRVILIAFCYFFMLYAAIVIIAIQSFNKK
ncbi:MAG: hypothetical protein L6U99_11245 [Clostridium sp.]|nr:MAG: hypothetical protein L6U99_11245 [Clostridium sp.]